MSKRLNIINNVISMVLTIVAMFATIIVCLNVYVRHQMIEIVLWACLGAIVAGFINALFHELGHFIAGKKNGFALAEISIWFFKWSVENGKVCFSFTLPLAEAGYTSMIPKYKEDMEKAEEKQQ